MVVLDQLALYAERLADVTQTDHFDWGFRITNLYGQDYRYTTSHGILSQQLLVKNSQYGYDPVMVYADLYFPKPVSYTHLSRRPGNSILQSGAR